MSKSKFLRNSKGQFINTHLFREDALNFNKNNFYTMSVENTLPYLDYWKEQHKRSIKGREIGGVRITGEHYFYLNFTPIFRVAKEELKKKGGQATKVYDFPDFWDGDYNYFWARALARDAIVDLLPHWYEKLPEGNYNKRYELLKKLGLYLDINPDYLTGGWNIIVGKSRRKGFAQPLDEPVYTKDGIKPMGDIQVGDEVVTPNGFAKVTQLHNTGMREYYIFETTGYQYTRVTADHLWVLYSEKTGEKALFTTKQLYEMSMVELKKYRLPKLLKDIDFGNNEPLDIDPEIISRYINYMASGTEDISEEDIQILKEKGFIYEDTFGIPDKYVYRTSPEDRRKLVKALSVNALCNRHMNMASINRLVYSIKGARISDMYGRFKIKGSKADFKCRDDNFRSTFTPKVVLEDTNIYINSISKINIAVPTKCITIDSEEHLYATRDLFFTHNSFKAASITSRNYSLIPNSKTYLVAYDSSYLYPDGLFSMAYDMLSFLNNNTAWNHPSDALNRPNAGLIRASYYALIRGRRVEKGFKSEIISKSVGNNKNVMRGKSGYDIFFEEAGAFGVPGTLKYVYKSTMDTAKAGAFKTGMITVFGTSGDLKASSMDYASMYFTPKSWEFLPFKNVWDDNYYKGKEVGFFFPINWNMEGYYDEWGNSDFAKAKELVEKSREMKRMNGATESDIVAYQQENPLSPTEAFMTSSDGILNVVDLQGRLMEVESQDLFKKMGMVIELEWTDDGDVKAIPVLDNKKYEPITDYHYIPNDKKGALIVYEPPIDTAPQGSYYIGYDPVMQPEEEGSSLASFLVYKSGLVSAYDKDKIVAEFIGRRSEDEIDDLIAKTAVWYKNSEIMHENMVPSVRTYFKRKGLTHLLARQPDSVISKHVKSSGVKRVYGIHMTAELRIAAERYIKSWLKSIVDYDEKGNPIRAYQKIVSPRLLKELIYYNRDGNFDMISSLMMLMFQREQKLIFENSKKDTNFTQEFYKYVKHRS